jgi:hypothetical protein
VLLLADDFLGLAHTDVTGRSLLKTRRALPVAETPGVAVSGVAVRENTSGFRGGVSRGAADRGGTSRDPATRSCSLRWRRRPPLIQRAPAGRLGGKETGGRFVFGSRRSRLEPWRTGFAVRRGWPVDGTHEFVGFRVSRAAAGWFAVADRRYWRRCHVRPTYEIVAISARDFELHSRHRRLCRAPDCPKDSEPTDAVVEGVGVVW